MKLHHIIIALLVVGMITTGLTVYIADLGANYGQTANLNGLNNTIEQLEATRANVGNLSEDILTFGLDDNENSNVLLIPYQMIKISWDVLKSIIGSFATVSAIISDLFTFGQAQGIPIPAWLVGSLQAIFIITIVAIVVYGLFKWKFDDA